VRAAEDRKDETKHGAVNLVRPVRAKSCRSAAWVNRSDLRPKKKGRPQTKELGVGTPKELKDEISEVRNTASAFEWN